MEQQQVINGFQLSPQQKRLWRPQRDNSIFCSQIAVLINGELNIARLKSAIGDVVNRHEILRTTFSYLPGMSIPVQVVADYGVFDWSQLNGKNIDSIENRDEIDRLCFEARRAIFDLENGPVLRCCLISLKPQENLLLLTLPALCADGWSLNNLTKEIVSIYGSSHEDVLDDPVQYLQFSEWQNALLDEQEGETEKFRRDGSGGLEFSLPTLEQNIFGASSDFDGICRLNIPGDFVERLNDLSKKTGKTVEDILLTCWMTLLWRLSSHSRIPVSVHCDGRIYEPMYSGLGLYARWPRIEATFYQNLRFSDMLNRVSAAQQEVREWQEYFSGEEINNRQNESTDRTFHTVGFSYELIPSARQTGNIVFSIHDKYSGTDCFDLRLACTQTEDQVKFEFHYNSALCRPDAADRLSRSYLSLLQNVIKDHELDIAELNILNELDLHQVLVEWNDTETDNHTAECLHRLFEEQSERTPDSVAVVFESQVLTFSELNRRANQIANHLLKLGVDIEDKVAICLERSVELVVAVLGVLKSGAAYVPLDSHQPGKRLSIMLDDSRAKVLLTQRSILAKFSNHQTCLVCLDFDAEAIFNESDETPRIKVCPENLAYLIYTSGSTGQPKGVMIEHGSVANLAHGLKERIYKDQRIQLRISLNAPLSFDSSVKQLLQLISGHTLYILPEDIRRDGDGLSAYLLSRMLDVLDCTPSQLSLLLASSQAEACLSSLSLVLLGGEAIENQMWSSLSQRDKFHNLYGPTECTVDATTSTLNCFSGRPTIGRPLINAKTYISNNCLLHQPVGIPGELIIGGPGVSRGYFDRPDLTAEKFVPDPFAQRAGFRLYRTGDSARYMTDGNIEFLGRLDHQVKIRGSRIELGEIEAILMQQPSVRRVAVVVREDSPGEKRLVAYIVARPGMNPSVTEIRSFLQERLPDYMMPSVFVMLEAMPLMASGKIDRNALPVPEQIRSDSEITFANPTKPTEEVLATIWAESLGIDRVGVNDNFFELGGHSLLATQVVSRVRKTFHAEIPLRALFETPTLMGLARHIQRALASGDSSDSSIIEIVSRNDDLPLSYAQQRLWFIQQFAPESTAYSIPSAVHLNGGLNICAFEQTLNAIVNRHEILRTTFPEIKGVPVQSIAPRDESDLPLVDLTGLSDVERNNVAHRLARQEMYRPFDITKGPLIRASLLMLKGRENVLLRTIHHIVFDDWSIGVAGREIVKLYDPFYHGYPSPLSELPIQYADYAVWQRKWLQGDKLEAQLKYWKEQLIDLPILDLPTDRPRPPVQTFTGATRTVELPRELLERLKLLSRHEHVTFFMTLLAAFNVLLYYYTGQEDIVVGTPIANRGREETEELIGFFLNTLAMRTDLSGDPNFRTILARVREMALNAYAHQDLPFEKLVEELQPARDLSRPPLFQVLFTVVTPQLNALEMPDLSLGHLELKEHTSKFDLTLFFHDKEDGLGALIEYNTSIFEAETIALMLEHLHILLDSVVSNPDLHLSELSILSDREKQQSIAGWNDTLCEYQSDLCINQLFESQAAQTPDAIAVSFDQEQLSYYELNRRANLLAHYLRSHGAGPEAIVGILLERSIQVMIGILAVIKAGAAYLIFDPAYPDDRLATMLEDAGPVVVLSSQDLSARLSDYSSTSISFDDDWESISIGNEDNPVNITKPDNLAYVIYTSGSTGKPKGVAMIHRPLVNLICWQIREAAPELKRTLQFASLSFDVSFQEIFFTWCSGGTLILISETTKRESSALWSSLKQHEIQRLFLPFVALQQLAEQSEIESRQLALREIITAGEQLQITRQIVGLSQRLQTAVLYNQYGPSEAHVVSCFGLSGSSGDWPSFPPIGSPIANTQIYLLSSHRELALTGVPGELYIGGDCLARGYLGKPELTATRFIPNPFGFRPGERLYATGDLARHRRDGNIEFLRRIDNQVKIRGFRVELGEIEAALRENPDIKEAVVIVQNEAGSGKRLVAYFVSEFDVSPSMREIRTLLRQKLPDYMIPSLYVRLDSLPLTATGKINRRALPQPDHVRPEIEQVFVPPRTAFERVLASFWADTLAIETIGIEDNFFDLGGHSLLATRIVSRVREIFQIELPLRLIFEMPTISGIADRMIEEERRPGTLEKIAKMFEELSQLSDSEAESRLYEHSANSFGKSAN